MGDRTAISPQRALAQLNEQFAANLRAVNRRILSPGSSGDTFTPGSQSVSTQSTGATSFTTVATLDVLAGSWLVSAVTSVVAGSIAFVASYGNLMTCRLRAGGVTLDEQSHVDPALFRYNNVGHSFALVTRVTFAAATTVTLEVQVTSDSTPLPGSCSATRTRMVVSPY
jgi:hypothetical protein